MTEFPQQLPHGELEEVFPDVFFVRGQIQIPTPDTVVLATRSMVVVRDGNDLSLINSIRLDDEGLRTLDALGNVRNILRIGGNHGRDDAFYSDRYQAPVWSPAGITGARPVHAEATLDAGAGGPIRDTTVMLFETTKAPEAVVCLNRHDGILVTADSFHNMPEPDEFIDAASEVLLREAGFFRPANIGPVWRKREQPDKSDYERLLSLPFSHLLPGHGVPIRNNAKEVLSQSVNELF